MDCKQFQLNYMHEIKRSKKVRLFLAETKILKTCT